MPKDSWKKLTKEYLEAMRDGREGLVLTDIPALCDMALASLEDDCQGHATQAEMKACKFCQAAEPTFTCLTCGEGFDEPTGLGHPACPNCRSINYTDTSEIEPEAKGEGDEFCDCKFDPAKSFSLVEYGNNGYRHTECGKLVRSTPAKEAERTEGDGGVKREDLHKRIVKLLQWRPDGLHESDYASAQAQVEDELAILRLAVLGLEATHPAERRRVMNLYRVTLRGLITGSQASLSPAYVVAPDAESAYAQVKAWADENDYGFYDARILDKVELMATIFTGLPNHPAPLFLPKGGE